MGWLFRAADTERALLDRANVKDLAQHSFYRWLEDTWVAHALARFFLTWYLFGWGNVVWTNALPILIGWHFIFLDVLCRFYVARGGAIRHPSSMPAPMESAPTAARAATPALVGLDAAHKLSTDSSCWLS